jgi:hypothetical protein
MAKLFYSLQEAARKMGKSEDQVKQMVASGQLQEFRDDGRIVLKREQVDLLAGDDGSDLTLSDSNEISLADSGSGPAVGGNRLEESTKERSGISIFEADELEDTSDASAQTQMTSSIGATRTQLDAGGSGSGLLDITRNNADDTGIGAGLMQDIYSGGDERSSAGVAAGAGGGGALFESTNVTSDVGLSAASAAAAAAGASMFVPEAIDGPGSGLAGGLALGMSLSALVGLLAVINGLVGGGGLSSLLGENFIVVVGALAAITLVCGVVGFVLGRKK